MNRFLVTFLFVVLFLCVGSNGLFAAIYKYKDDKGTTIFVDAEWKIPEQYREKTRTITESSHRPAFEREGGAVEVSEEGDGQESSGSGKGKKQKFVETTIKMTNNQILVPVKVKHGGKSAMLTLLLDTGANRTALHSSAMNKFHFTQKKASAATIAGGGTIKTTRVTLNALKVGPHLARDMPVIILDHPEKGHFDGLLGMDFFRTRGYKIEGGRSVIIWTTPPK